MFTKDWPMGLFLKFYPEFRDLIPPVIFSDPEYIVRSQHLEDGTLYSMEFGYADDNWTLPEPKQKTENLENN